jgi:hypothetical protein
MVLGPAGQPAFLPGLPEERGQPAQQFGDTASPARLRGRGQAQVAAARARRAVRLGVRVGQHARDDLVLGGRQIDLRGGQMRVAQDPLHIAQRQLRVARHPRRRAVPQVVQGPVRAEHGVGSLEHSMRGVIAQRSPRTAQGPPHRLSPAPGRSAVQLLLIQPQPHERVRRRRHQLRRAAALAHHRDQLLARVDVALARTQQLRRPRPGRDPERHQRPVPVRPQSGKQLVEPIVGDRPGQPSRHLRSVTPHALAPPPVHRVVVRLRPPGSA